MTCSINWQTGTVFSNNKSKKSKNLFPYIKTKAEPKLSELLLRHRSNLKLMLGAIPETDVRCHPSELDALDNDYKLPDNNS